MFVRILKSCSFLKYEHKRFIFFFLLLFFPWLSLTKKKRTLCLSLHDCFFLCIMLLWLLCVSVPIKKKKEEEMKRKFRKRVLPTKIKTNIHFIIIICLVWQKLPDGKPSRDSISVKSQVFRRNSANGEIMKWPGEKGFFYYYYYFSSPFLAAGWACHTHTPEQHPRLELFSRNV